MRSIRISLVAVCILAFALLALADEPGKPSDLPHSPKAKAAIDKHRTAANKARAEYYAKLMALDSQLVNDLESALKAAAKTGDANEIERVATARKKAQAELKQHHEELEEPTYWLWETSWSTFHSQIWLKSDGTCIEQSGVKGTWQRRGNQLIISLSNGNHQYVMVSDDGQSYVGKDQGRTRLTGKLLGTSKDGAAPPPE